MPSKGRRAPASSPETLLRKQAQDLRCKAMKTLAALMQDAKTPAPIRLSAAREILDRGHGRPKLGDSSEEGEGGGMTVIVKRYSDVTDEEKALAEQGEP